MSSVSDMQFTKNKAQDEFKFHVPRLHICRLTRENKPNQVRSWLCIVASGIKGLKQNSHYIQQYTSSRARVTVLLRTAQVTKI